MNKWLDNPIVVIALIFCLGLGIRLVFLKPTVAEPSAASTQDSTEAFFAAKIPDLTGTPQALSQYKGKLLVVNFWATWCPPCREEMPELSALQNQYRDKNLVVLGLATDELALVQDFAKSDPVSYPLLAADAEGSALAETLGNNRGVLPYTVVIRPDGSIANVYFGRIDQATLEQTLLPIINALSNNKTN